MPLVSTRTRHGMAEPAYGTSPGPGERARCHFHLQARRLGLIMLAMSHCPDCHTVRPPEFVAKIATAGWVVFAALLLVCFPLCWLGLFIKERYRVCPECGRRSELTASELAAQQGGFPLAIVIALVFIAACLIIGRLAIKLLVDFPH